MKTNRNIILLLALSLSSLLVMSCSEQSLVAPGEYNFAWKQKPIVGEWNWTETVNFAGVRTPSTTGHTSKYVFNADGTLLRYRDNAVQSTTHYTLSNGGGLFVKSGKAVEAQMHIEDEPDCVYQVKIENGTMALEASQEDLGISKFAKNNE